MSKGKHARLVVRDETLPGERVARGDATHLKGAVMTDTAVAVATRTGPVPAPAAPPADPMFALLQAAIDKGVDVGTMEKLVALHERVGAVNAAREYSDALAQFQAECPPLPKSKKARITPRSGASYEYHYAPLEVIVPLIREPLRKHGFSYTWDTEVAEQQMRIICRVRHVSGHTETSSIVMPLTSASGMSDQQRVANARTFGMRLTLCSALGLVTGEEDTDGGDANPAVITEVQAQELETMAQDAGADVPRFLKWLHADSFAAIRAIDYQAAVGALQRAARRKAAQA